MRRAKWEAYAGWDDGDLDRELGGREVLPEDLQDQSSPMVVVGTDVVNLYPSLDISQVVEEVREAVMDTDIKWEDIDYLEAARYVVLNWSEEQCIKSGLRRILPKRRKKNGTRPGLTGEGPQGALRGDQEQWIFPRVELTKDEKKWLIATVVQLATEAMFKHHYYIFGGNKFQQKVGGPIGLRGTCSISRLVMQVFDRKWWNKVMGEGLLIKLYMRYMDDGRKFLHPIKWGWRWVDGELKLRKRWE